MESQVKKKRKYAKSTYVIFFIVLLIGILKLISGGLNKGNVAETLGFVFGLFIFLYAIVWIIKKSIKLIFRSKETT